MKTRSTKNTEQERQAAFHDLVRQVRKSVSIEKVLADVTGTRLVGHGTSRMACCPFHDDQTPSMSVDLEKGLYYCHSAGCGAAGDIFTLMTSTHAMSFPEAVCHLAKSNGIPIPDALAIRMPRDPGHLRRKTIIYPSDAPRMVPAALPPASLASLPASAEIPAPGRWVRAWKQEDAGKGKAMRYLPEMVHPYRGRDGLVRLVILRCLTRGQKNGKARKFFIPLTLSADPTIPSSCAIPGASEGDRWRVSGLPEATRKPLYGIEQIPHGATPSTIMIVEGEKTADAGRRLAASAGMAIPVLSPMGGGAAPLRADWTPLLDIFGVAGNAPVRIIIWPDADSVMRRPDGRTVDRQKKFIDAVAGGLLQALVDFGLPVSAVQIGAVRPPSGKPSGWDLADAETEGWDGQAFRDYIDTSLTEVLTDEIPLRNYRPEGVPGPREPAGDDDGTSNADGVDGLMSEINEMLLEMEARDAGRDDTASTVLSVDHDVDELTDAPDHGDTSLDGGEISEAAAAIIDNPHFRPLGYHAGMDFFVSLESGFIYGLSPQMLKSSYFLKLARKDWWERHFPKKATRKSDEGGVDWESASDALIGASYATGTWDPERECGQGACLDGGLVVYNTGSTLWVEGMGQMPIRDFRGKNCYTVNLAAPMPAFHNPFSANDPAMLALLDIIASLNWQPEHRELSIMGLFGWMCIGPISGIMSWRPHLWLSGPRSAGKSWVIKNIIARALGDYACYIKSNSTEPGIRRNLHGKSMPLIFDEAEGETRQDRERIDSIIRMARHAASEDRSVVMQANTGGAERYRIKSSFLFSSITPQLEASADKTRFALAQLNEGHGLDAFMERIEGPAEALLTPEFSQRFIARMILRAPDLHETYRLMVLAMHTFRVERRIIDVYAAFAAGAWLMLRDGLPEDHLEAVGFIAETFDIVVQLEGFGDRVRDEKDHNRLFRTLQSTPLRVETAAMGPRMISIGALMASAIGIDEEEGVVSQAEAIQALKEIGIRPGIITAPGASREDGFDLIEPGEVGDCLVIHRNAIPIQQILKDTPYARDYSQVMLQEPTVFRSKTARFSHAIGIGRTLVVPIAIFSLGEGDEDQKHIRRGRG